MMPRRWAAWIGTGQQVHELGRARGPAGGCRRGCGPGSRLDEFERQVRPAFVLADLVDLHDVRMLEPGDRLGLAAESVELSRRRVGAAKSILSATSRFSRRCRAL